MADPRRSSTRRAVLSYDQFKDLYKQAGVDIPDLLTKDYQGIFQDFVFLADAADGLDALIADNTANITTNATNITTNTTNITTNATNITTNATNLTNHENSDSEHGVTGNNVGTGDFCTEILGGVVFLMETVTNAVNSTETIALPDIAAAPAAYSQTYANTLAAMANDTKAKHNQLVLDLNLAIAQINDIIAKAKTAKQMVV